MNKILVTGGAGFIAHHIIEDLLVNTNCKIVTVDSLDFSGNLNRLSGMLKNRQDLSNRIEYLYHDIRAEINPTLAKQIGDVDYILHLAAGSHVDRSIKDPLSFVYTNVVGTCNILNFARTQKNLKRFLYFSTDEIFGPALKDTNFSEYSRYNSSNPYSATKAGGEELAVAFHNTYNMPVYITHCMNVFGERQQAGAFIPLCIRKILNNEKLTIHSDVTLTKSPIRHYIYVKEVASAIRFLLENNFTSNDSLIKVPKFNITGRDEIQILELSKTIAKLLNKELQYEMTYTQRPGGDMGYSLSGNLLKSLGWEAKSNFSDHIEKVVNWYVDNKAWL